MMRYLSQESWFLPCQSCWAHQSRCSCMQLECRLVNLSALLLELLRHLLHACVHRFFLIYIVLLSILSELLSDAHWAKLRPTHGAEVCCLGWLLRQCCIMEKASSDGIQGQVELVIPPELKSSCGKRVIPLLSVWVTLHTWEKSASALNNSAVLNASNATLVKCMILALVKCTILAILCLLEMLCLLPCRLQTHSSKRYKCARSTFMDLYKSLCA